MYANANWRWQTRKLSEAAPIHGPWFLAPDLLLRRTLSTRSLASKPKQSAIEIFVYQNASSTFLSQFRVEEVSPAIAILVLHVVWFIVPLSGRSPVGTDISFRFRLLDIFRYFQYFLLDLGRTSAASSTSSAFSANQFHNWQFYSINCTLFSFAIQSITKCRSSFIVHRSSLIR